jgi:hypothetical protein
MAKKGYAEKLVERMDELGVEEITTHEAPYVNPMWDDYSKVGKKKQMKAINPEKMVDKAKKYMGG